MEAVAAMSGDGAWSESGVHLTEEGVIVFPAPPVETLFVLLFIDLSFMLIVYNLFFVVVYFLIVLLNKKTVVSAPVIGVT